MVSDDPCLSPWSAVLASYTVNGVWSLTADTSLTQASFVFRSVKVLATLWPQLEAHINSPRDLDIWAEPYDRRSIWTSILKTWTMSHSETLSLSFSLRYTRASWYGMRASRFPCPNIFGKQKYSLHITAQLIWINVIAFERGSEIVPAWSRILIEGYGVLTKIAEIW